MVLTHCLQRFIVTMSLCSSAELLLKHQRLLGVLSLATSPSLLPTSERIGTVRNVTGDAFQGRFARVIAKSYGLSIITRIVHPWTYPGVSCECAHATLCLNIGY